MDHRPGGLRPASILIIAAGGLCLVFGMLYAYPALSLAISEEFGWPRRALGLVFSIRLVVGAIGQASLGAIIKRYGAGRASRIAALVFASSLALCGLSDALWHFAILFGVLAGASSSLLELCVLSSIAGFLPRRRGLAAGMAWAGGGFGFTTFIPLAQLLVEGIGWRATYAIFASLAFALAILMPISFRGCQQALIRKEQPAQGRHTKAHAMGRRVFWMLYGGNVCIGLFHEAIYQHAIPYLHLAGFSQREAASSLGVASGFYIVGQILGGWYSDKKGREHTTTMASLLMVSAIIGMLQINGTHTGWLCMEMAAFGAGLGAVLAVRTASWTDIFPPDRFVSVSGLILSGYAIGGAFSAWFGGWCFDIIGEYAPIFYLSIAAALAWCGLLWNVAPRRYVQLSAGMDGSIP